MIEKLLINNPQKVVCPWWKEVPFCTSSSQWDFQEGLNIIWGPNGSGKSTFIKTLAKLLHCEQGGVSTVTQRSVGDFTGRDGAEAITDGQVVQYLNPDDNSGLVGSSLDDDFFDEGLRGIFRKRASSGQQTIMKVNDLSGDLQKEIPDRLSGVNDIWENWKQKALVSLQPRIPRGKPSILMDEPELHLDIPRQAQFWGIVIPNLLRKYQIIVATHSPWAANLLEARYFETSPGYLESCRKEISNLPRR